MVTYKKSLTCVGLEAWQAPGVLAIVLAHFFLSGPEPGKVFRLRPEGANLIITGTVKM